MEHNVYTKPVKSKKDWQANYHLMSLCVEGVDSDFPVSADLHTNDTNIQSPSFTEIAFTDNCVFALHVPVKHLTGK